MESWIVLSSEVAALGAAALDRHRANKNPTGSIGWQIWAAFEASRFEYD
jgi:hypothetical protein